MPAGDRIAREVQLFIRALVLDNQIGNGSLDFNSGIGFPGAYIAQGSGFAEDVGAERGGIDQSVSRSEQKFGCRFPRPENIHDLLGIVPKRIMRYQSHFADLPRLPLAGVLGQREPILIANRQSPLGPVGQLFF